MIIVIGSNGQLGSEVVKACDRYGLGCVGLAHDDFELRNLSDGELDKLDTIKGVYTGDLTIINTAAYHDLGKCEQFPDQAWLINSLAPGILAQWCAYNKAKFVHISTDYCDGKPTDASGLPLSVYAKTKLAGELGVLIAYPEALIVRVGTLYGVAGCRAKGGGNFVDTVVGKVKRQEPFMLPDYTCVLTAYARDAAERIVRNLGVTGVWYATDQCRGESHYRLGCRIAALLGLPNKIQAVSQDPNDTLRPHTTEVPINETGSTLIKYRRLETEKVTEPLYNYMVEKGYINDQTCGDYTISTSPG